MFCFRFALSLQKLSFGGCIMDGLIDFIIFVGFIGFCIFFNKINEVMKKAQQQAPSKPVVVNIPPQQKSNQPSQPQKTARKVKKINDGMNTYRQSKDITQRMEFQNEGVRSTENIMQPLETQPHSEYEMNTAEDIRKAIVWSEVLKRKY